MKKVTGIDSYNLNLTGGVSMTMSAKSSDDHHVPCVLIEGDADGQGSDRSGLLLHEFHGGVAGTLRSARADMEHQPAVLIYDAHGRDGGGIGFTLLGDHENRIAETTTILVKKEDEGDA